MSEKNNNHDIKNDDYGTNLCETESQLPELEFGEDFHALFEGALSNSNSSQAADSRSTDRGGRTAPPIAGARSHQQVRSRTPRQAGPSSRPLGAVSSGESLPQNESASYSGPSWSKSTRPERVIRWAHKETQSIVDMDTEKTLLAEGSSFDAPTEPENWNRPGPLPPPIEGAGEGYVQLELLSFGETTPLNAEMAGKEAADSYLEPPPPMAELEQRVLPKNHLKLKTTRAPEGTKSPGSAPAAHDSVQRGNFSAYLWEAKQTADLKLPLDGDYELSTRLRRFLAVCNAVAYAHSKGQLHGDIRPGNIHFDKAGKVQILGWADPIPTPKVVFVPGQPEAGFFQVEEFQDMAPVGIWTPNGVIVASPRYAPPECLSEGQRAYCAASEVYALGVLLYEVVTLRTPFPGHNVQDVLRRVIKGKPGALVHRTHSEVVPTAMVRLIRETLSLDPQDRLLGASALAQATRDQLRELALIERGRKAFGLPLYAAAAGSMALIAGGFLTMETDKSPGEAVASISKAAQWYSHASTQAHLLNDYLTQQGVNAATWGTAAERVLVQKRSSDLPFHTVEDFEYHGKLSKYLVDSRVHGMPVSLDHASYNFQFAPGRSEAKAIATKLQWLSPRFMSTLLASHSALAANSNDSYKHQLITQVGTPAHRLFVTTNEGIHMVYPGHGGPTVLEDGRFRPSYLAAQKAPGIQWGRPYFSQSGQEVVIPVVQSLFDGQDFIGVAGLELVADHVVQELKRSAPQSAQGEAFLVNNNGNILAQSSRGMYITGNDRPGSPANLQPFPYPEVQQAISSQHSGWHVFSGEDERVAAFLPLQSTGWTYVVVSSPESDLQWEDGVEVSIFAPGIR